MTEETLSLLKVLLRVSSSAYDDEIKMLVDGAVTDMKRIGIKDEYLAEDALSPLALNAIACYVKARFGYDNTDAPFFEEQYRQLTIDLMNSEANVKASGE